MTVIERLPIIFSLLLLLSGCVSNPLTPKPDLAACQGTDWWEAGRTDGVSGLPPATEVALKGQCALLDDSAVELYRNGHDAGLVDYCTPAQGLAAGRSGEPYRQICPAHLEAAFLDSYRIGQRIYGLETDNSDLQSRIENLVRLMENSSTSRNLRSQIESLRAQQAKNRDELISIEGDQAF